MNPIIREKPHRLPRNCYQGRIVVSFTACIRDRCSPFLEKPIVDQFTESLRKSADASQCRVPIYCFMPDHLHVLLQGLADRSDAWRAMVAFKKQSGFWFGRNRPQFCWQKDFYDHILRSDEDLGSQMRYIADNPVRKGLVKLWADYPFTGAIGIDLQQVLADTATL